MSTRERPGARVAVAPSSWGISDLDGRGHQLSRGRVLAEAGRLGYAIEAGPPGFLPDSSDEARRLLKQAKLSLAAGGVRAIVHDHDLRGPELAHIDGHAAWLAALGARTLVLTAIPSRGAGGDGAATELSPAGWAHVLHSIGSVEHVCTRHGLKVAVQPEPGSMIDHPADIERLLVGCEAGISLDIGHLALMQADPLEVIELAGRRIQFVRLSDLERETALDRRTQLGPGQFRSLGQGDAGIERIVEALRRARYSGWYSIDERAVLTGEDDNPIAGIQASIDFLLPLLA